jgi:hypothetical protein
MLGSSLSPFTGHNPSVNMRKSHMRKILLLSASLLALTCTPGSAGSITIGLQEDAGATQQFSGGSNFAITGPLCQQRTNAVQQRTCLLDSLGGFHNSRETDGEGRSAARLALDRDVAAHHLTEAPHVWPEDHGRSKWALRGP